MSHLGLDDTQIVPLKSEVNPNETPKLSRGRVLSGYTQKIRLEPVDSAARLPSNRQMIWIILFALGLFAAVILFSVPFLILELLPVSWTRR
jgi:hypothetical protein